MCIRDRVVGADDGAVQFEFDNGLHFGNSLELALGIRLALLLFGNVGGVLDHLEGAAVFIEDGVVALSLIHI